MQVSATGRGLGSRLTEFILQLSVRRPRTATSLVILLAAIATFAIAPQAASAAPLFGPKSDFATGSEPRSVTSADFNADGKPDLAVANRDSNSVSVLLGNGSGGFGPKTDFTTGSGPFSVTSADFNADGKPDLAVANFISNNVSVLLGDGSGGFGPKTDFTTGTSPYSVTSADFNADGKPDLAIANGISSSVSVLINTTATDATTPSFGPKTDFTTGSSPFSVTSADFNADGKPDLAVANRDSNSVSVLLGNGSGGFGPKTDFTTGSAPYSVTSADFNADGKPDLAVANFNSNSVSVLLGDGSGGFGPKTDFTTGPSPNSVTSADFNADGKPDLATSNFNSNVSVLLGDGSGGFGPETDFTTGSTPFSVTSADFNTDGQPDLAVTSFFSTVSILLNQSPAQADGNFTAPSTSPEGAGSRPESTAVGDFNRDGKQDLATVNYFSDDVSILLGDGSGDFAAATASPKGVGDGPESVAVGDFNRDGKQDLATANFNSNDVTILLGDGAGDFTASVTSPEGVGSRPNSVAVGDFNRDGKQDLATANITSNNVSILLGDGTGNFTAASLLAVGNAPSSVAIGDFNGDGKPDLTTTNSDTTSVSILLGDGTGNFSTSSVGVGSNPYAVAVGDFNGDGKQDLATANPFTAKVSILLGDGTGGFALAPTSPETVGSNPYSIAVGDFNDDGKMDLASPSRLNNNVTILLGDGSGDFSVPSTSPEPVGSGPNSVAVGDFNRDGKQDLATANQLSNNVTILLGDHSPTAVDDSLTLAEDASATTIDVLANDADPDGGPKSIASRTNGLHGTVAITNSGANLTYTPDADYCGSDSFTYSLTPGGATAAVSVTVTCVDDPPTAAPDSKTLAEDAPATTIDVLANDLDIDGGPKAISSKTNGAHGTVAITNSGADLTYTPDADYCGSDSFTYTLTPGGATATVSVTISCVNAAPRSLSAGGPYTISEGDSLTLAGTATDRDGDPITYVWDLNGDGDFSDAKGASPTLSPAELMKLGISDGPASFDLRLRASDATEGATSTPVELHPPQRRPDLADHRHHRRPLRSLG